MHQRHGAIAKSLTAEGASVVVNYASSAGADASLPRSGKAGGKAAAPCAVTSVQGRALIVDAAVKHRRLISWSAIRVYGFSPLENITKILPPAFQRQRTRLAADHAGGAQAPRRRSSIINIGSVVTRITPPGSAVYTGTKGAVDAITGVLSRELGARKIRVNALNPGMVETEGTHTAGFIGSDFEAGTVAQTPLGRIGQPNDIASIAVFLASNDSYWLTGEQLLAGGGVR